MMMDAANPPGGSEIEFPLYAVLTVGIVGEAN